MGEDVIVHSSDDSPAEEIAEAVEQVAEQQQSFELGKVVGELHALEEKVEFHDALIQLHTHDGLATEEGTGVQIMETEDRLVGKVQSLIDRAEDAIENNETEEVMVEAESNESEAEAENSNDNDEPPKSRANRKPWAERYYNSSGHNL